MNPNYQGSCQVEHKEFGVFQGHCLGLGFWYPESDMPEQGFYEFPTYVEAEKFIQFMYTEAYETLPEGSLTIEPFDRVKSDHLMGVQVK